MSGTGELLTIGATGAKTAKPPSLNMTNYYIFSGVSGFILVIYGIMVLFTAKPVQFAGNTTGGIAQAAFARFRKPPLRKRSQ